MKRSKNNDAVIRIGLIDDHKAINNGLVMMLNQRPPIKVVLQAFSGEELMELMSNIKEPPEILLMDVNMKGMSGIEATRQITDLYPSVKTIAFSAKDDDWFVLEMFSAGACAFLSKDMSPADLESAIHEVHAKGKYQADLYHLNAGSLRKFSRDSENLSISEKEKYYLLLLCCNYSYSQMAAKMGVTIDSVNYYRSCLSKKLDAKGPAELAAKGLHLGIISWEEIKRTLKTPNV